MFKVFRVATQKLKKILNSEAYRIISKTLEFQILLSNEASNEKCLK